MNEFTPNEIELFLANDGDNRLYGWAAEQFSDGNRECFGLAIKIYKLLAERGHAFALNDLGALYSEGIYVVKDTKKAFDYYVKSAENGCTEACCNLGYFYLYGRNGETDYEKAFKYFSKGAIVGNDANCCYKLGDMYMYGDYVEKNPNIAFNFYLRAFKTFEKHGCTYETEFLSDIYYRIGKCLYYGNGVDEDKSLACEYLSDARDGYKKRMYDPYNYVEKRIEEINKILTEYTDICVATPVQIPEEEE